jgi:hypothetical protein
VPATGLGLVAGELERREGSADSLLVSTCEVGDLVGAAALLDDGFRLPLRHVSSVYPKGDEAVVVLWAVECVEALSAHAQLMVRTQQPLAFVSWASNELVR